MAATEDRVRIFESTVLSDDWYTLKEVTFDFLRRDGTWQCQSSETFDLGNGATILLHNRHTGNVVLTRQCRMPMFVNGHDGIVIEAAAGLLDNATPEERIRLKAEEETGYRVSNIRKVFEACMSPGSVTEKLYFYLGDYDASMCVNEGVGVEDEGEDLEVLEMPFWTDLKIVKSGKIVDGKTIMLLQHLALSEIAEGCRA